MSWFSNSGYARPTGSHWRSSPKPNTKPTTAVGTAVGPTVSRRNWDTGASSSSGLGSVLNNLTGNLSASSQLGQQGSADTAATLRSQGFGGLKKTKDFTSKAADFANTAGNAIALTTNPGQVLRNNWQSALQTGPNPATATGRTFADLNNSLNTVQALSNKGKNVPFGADIGSLAFQATPWGKLATLATGAGGDNVPDTLERFARPVTNLVGKAGKTGKKLEDWLNKGARSIGTPVQEVFNLGQRIPGVKEVGRQIHGVTTQLGTENPYGPYAPKQVKENPVPLGHRDTPRARQMIADGNVWNPNTRQWEGTGKPNYDAIMAEAVRANRGSQYEKDWQDWQRELDPGVDLSSRTYASQQALIEANNRGQTNQPSDAFRNKLLVPTEEQERRYGRGYAIPNLAGATNKWASADVSNRKARDYSNLAGSTLTDVANQTVGFTNQAKTLTKEAEDFKESLRSKPGGYTQDDVNHFNSLRQQIANANASASDGYNGMAEAGLIQKDAQGRMSWTDSARSRASQDARIGFGHDVANYAADQTDIGRNVRSVGNVIGNEDMGKYGQYAQLAGNLHNIATSPNPVGRTLEGVDRVGEAINPASITGKIARGIASPFGSGAVDRVGRITGPAERGVDVILNNTFGLPSKLHKYFTKPDPIPQRDWRTGEAVPQVGSRSEGRGRTWDRETRRWVEGTGTPQVKGWSSEGQVDNRFNADRAAASVEANQRGVTTYKPNAYSKSTGLQPGMEYYKREDGRVASRKKAEPPPGKAPAPAGKKWVYKTNNYGITTGIRGDAKWQLVNDPSAYVTGPAGAKGQVQVKDLRAALARAKLATDPGAKERQLRLTEEIVRRLETMPMDEFKSIDTKDPLSEGGWDALGAGGRHPNAYGTYTKDGVKYETNEKGDWKMVLPDGSHGDPITGEKGKIHYFGKEGPKGARGEAGPAGEMNFGDKVQAGVEYVGTSVGNTLALPFKAAANLVGHPIRTTRNVALGLGHNVENLAQSLRRHVPRGVRQTFNPGPDESRLQGLVNTVLPIAAGVKAANPQFWYEKALRHAALDPFNRDMYTTPQDDPSPMPVLTGLERPPPPRRTAGVSLENPHSSVPLKKSGKKYNTFAPPVVGRSR